MPSFPTYTFDKTCVKARFFEPNGSESVNTRQYGLPRGVYLGLTPETTTGSMILKLKPDPRLGFSMFKTGAQSTRVNVDVFCVGDVELNFTGHTVFPVYVIGRADYVAGTPSQGRLLTRTTGPVGPQEIVVCQVSKPASDLVVSTTVPTHRRPPLAFSGQGVGYMYGGATDDLVFAQGATSEVIKSRDNLTTPPAPPAASLSARLANDLSGTAIANLLALKSAYLAGNVRSVTAGATSMNISDSFSEVTREIAPAITLAPNANETTEGAVTAPGDTDRNVAFLVEEGTGLRLETSAGGPVYGRVVYTTAPLTGLITFVQADDEVTGSGTFFSTELQVGDLILAPNGKYYAVESIPNNTNLVLTTAYPDYAPPNVASIRRRFTLNFFSRTTGVETAFALTQNRNIRPFFPAWFRLDRSVFDASTFMKKVGEMPNVPSATDSVRGLVKLAVAGGLAGAIYQITNGNSSIGANNFHTLNFTAVNASVLNAGGGVANITVPGNPGPAGPGAVPGPTGPTGPPGPGANAANVWEVSTLYGPGGIHTFTVTYASGTPPFTGNVVHAVGGIALSDPFSGAPGPGQHSYRITDISKSSNTASITVDLTGLSGITQAKVFLGACT
jgi:hypothetical protein